jgi:hypothetical protein
MALPAISARPRSVMPILMVRHEVDEDSVAEVVNAVEQTVATLTEHKPHGVRYLYLRRSSGMEFIALLELDESVANRLPAITAAHQVQAAVDARATGPAPTSQAYDVLGRWR